MKYVSLVLTFGFFLFVASTGVLAEDTGIVVTDLLPEDTPFEAAADVTVSITPSPVTKGNAVHVNATYAAQPCPLKATCIFVLPTSPPGLYKETMIFSRQYACDSTTSGVNFSFFVPEWIQIGGTGIALVIIDGLGFGFETVQIN
jgi:hypothetical protein